MCTRGLRRITSQKTEVFVTDRVQKIAEKLQLAVFRNKKRRYKRRVYFDICSSSWFGLKAQKQSKKTEQYLVISVTCVSF